MIILFLYAGMGVLAVREARWREGGRERARMLLVTALGFVSRGWSRVEAHFNAESDLAE